MVASSKFAHVAFNARRYDEMIDWYAGVFEARVEHRDDRLALLAYDDERHRLVFVNLGAAGDRPEMRPALAPRLNQLGDTWRNLDELIGTYTGLKSRGILPTKSIRQGTTLSLYYCDLDGNGLEFQVDLMKAKGADKFMRGLAFADNPVGEPFDPEGVAARLVQDKPVNDLIFRSYETESLSEIEALLPL
jgi:catechol-2,3-dioxygenase